jgi:hypothetical protein
VTINATLQQALLRRRGYRDHASHRAMAHSWLRASGRVALILTFDMGAGVNATSRQTQAAFGAELRSAF